MADRVTNYVYQTPLTADDLLRQRDFDLIALGKLVADLLGTSTMASGLAATAVSSTTIPTVELGDGSVYELGTLDPTAYGSLTQTAFPSTANVMKQGLLLASRGDVNQFQLAAPTTAGDSVIYLIEAQYSDFDTNIQTITLYNVSNPSNPNTATEPRQRWGVITIVAKAGVPSSSPVAPTADAGYIPLYAIEVAYGQTVLSQANISVASAAPFLTQKLFDLMNESGTVNLPAVTSSGLITANGGITVPVGETATVDGTLDVTGTATIPNATANNQPVALAQLLHVAPIGAATGNASTTSQSVTTASLTAPCDGMLIISGDASCTPNVMNGFSVTSSLAGLVQSANTSTSTNGFFRGYLPMTAGQATTLTINASSSSTSNLAVYIFGTFIPTP